MKFNYKYKGSSTVENSSQGTSMNFVPDSKREPTFFNGKLNKKLPFREAISTLHHIVVSDLRYQKKDKTEYLEWAKSQEEIWLAEAMLGAEDVKHELLTKSNELKELNKVSNEVLAPFYKARRDYFSHLYTRDRDAWYVLDPVITVHPDEVFFECFSKDESTYGKLSCNYNVFKEMDEFSCGTTNVDYSYQLYDEFQKIRNYKDTQFKIDPSGFEVETTAEESYKEIKIDLPDSWVRGFLQVSSAMTLGSYEFNLDVMDLSNILFFLRRNKEKKSPRSIRWRLIQGKPIEAILEPWNKSIICKNSIYKGKNEGEIRMWGRRRLFQLERILPVTDSIKVTMLGTGLPTFFEMNMSDMTFTMGLSGWTANDWSQSANFDLMTPRLDTDGMTQQKVYLALKKKWFSDSKSLEQETGITQSLIESSLMNFIQEGKVVYDISNKVYRIRELTNEPIPIEQLRYKNPIEEKAVKLIQNKGVKYKSYKILENGIRYIGKVKGEKKYPVEITLSDDERMKGGKCECRYYNENKLHKGPCEHMMALRKIATIKLQELIK